MKEYEKRFIEAQRRTFEELSEVSDFMKLDEKQLFGKSLEAQYNKMLKNVQTIMKELKELKVLLKNDPKLSDKPDTPESLQKIDRLLESCNNVYTVMTDQNFMVKMYKIDNNTGWFGGAKDKSQLTSKDLKRK